MKQKSIKGSSKWVYALTALSIIAMYGLLGKADINAATLEQNVKQCDQHITQEAYKLCIKDLNN